MSQDAPDTRPAKPAGLPALRLALLVLLAVGAAATAGLLMARLQSPDKPSGGGTAEQPVSPELSKAADKYFPSWPAGKKPELVILLSGQQHNYEQPCGCTEPQLGGLERRYNFVKFLRDQKIGVVPLDLGDVYYSHYEPGRPTLTEQLKLKYRMSMNALSLMGYEAVCVGKEEFGMPLIEALAATVLNSDPSYSFLVANLKDRAINFPPKSEGSPPMIGDFKVTKTPIKVGVIGTVGQSVADEVGKIDRSVAFLSNGEVVPATLKAMAAQNPDVRVLLYQGTETEAKTLAGKITDFDVILCLSAESEPPSEAAKVGKTQIIRVGHKGRYVGLVGVFRTADGKLDLKYDLVPMDPEFRTPPEQAASNPALKLLDEYTVEVKANDLLSRYPEIAHSLQVKFPSKPGRPEPQFVGSKKCQECHQKEFQVWDTSKHAAAYETLVENRKPPLNRQFDGECVVCHTIGFGYKSGYRDDQKTPDLKGVGCENCHGPGSLHIADAKNKEVQLAMSPWKQKPGDDITNAMVEKVIFRTCFHCHDTDNDPHFDLKKNWPKIGHGKNANAFKGAGAAAKKD